MAEQPLPVFVLACVGCGKTVSGREEKCPRCGASFDDIEFECPFCGETVTALQSKCESCGTEFEIFAEEVAEMAVVALDREAIETSSQPEQPGAGQAVYECPSCGKPVDESDTKCPNCGAIFTE
ncbi:MAG TPA: zinc ribbon domain-containing protein [Thermoplasmata archaeon]|nr:zinc ribbon domain-containing protein [Thermoplasmata archaeon]